MKTMCSLSLIGLLAACGGSKEEAREPAAPPPAPIAEPAPAPEPAPVEEPVAATAPAEPTPAPEPVQATPVTATAELKAYAGDASVGTLTFEVGEGGKINITGTFTGLKPGPHALYIHENGDCGKKGKAAGGHFNPTKAKHGGLGSADRHAGDFGDVVADDAGNASLNVPTDSITVEEGGSPTSVVGKAVIVYTKKDSPSGKAGAPLACGVITLPSEGSAPTERTTQPTTP